MSEDTLPVWQKLYQIVSGSNENVIGGVIDDVIDICKQNLPNVLLVYEVYTKESFDKWKKSSKSEDDEMCSFIHRISKELDLDVTLASGVICNFLIFDYYGRVDELKSIIRYEANIKFLIDQLWNFYTSDRMFMLKTLRFILEKVTDKDFMYYEEFNLFFQSIDLKKLWKNLLKTFENLITEINSNKSKRVTESSLIQWMERNNREQVEVLLLMILVIDFMDLSGNELDDALKLFMRHGFGRHPLFFGAGFSSRPKDIIDIKNAEIGVILTIIHRYWQSAGVYEVKLSKEVESDLEQYQIQGDNTCILFFWVIFKVSTSNSHLDYYRNVLEMLLDKKVFKPMAKFVTLNIFKNCKPGEIIVEAINRLFIEICKLFDNNRLIYEQEGVVTILCELYKRPYLHALETLGVFFQIAFDMFPYMLHNFLDMVESVILCEEFYAKTIKLLHNCPTYCTEILWPYNSEAITSTEEKNLFLGTDKFIIPVGTLLEKCNCFGEDMIKFHYKYDFFDIIEQYIRSLTSWAFNKGDYNRLIFNYVIRANKFIIYLVKHYRGNFENDTVLRSLLQRLDCVPTYYNKGGLKNFDFFCVYFEAKCALVKYQNVDFNEAFPSLIRKLLFPVINDYNNVKRHLEILQTSKDCILYGFLKQEESHTDHKLLIEYIEIIRNVLEKETLYREVLYSGVWYLLYVVFPSYKQWKYDDGEPFQQTKILHGCLQVFITVLQQDPKHQLTLEQKELYKLVHESFLNDSYIIESLYKIFVQGKYHLPSLMHQESNWIAGNTLIVLDTVKSELVLLLLIFKCRAKLQNVKCEIDDKTHTFAKSASIYFVTPYNCTLAVLAGKFLEILGRNDEIPLMSCLALDYDQIQTLFLERLRDPMEDEEVKLNILNLISTCIFHQTGMTAAFFNVQSSKKWYNPDAKKIEGETVCDFMIDYLQNIKKSVEYFKSPLQVGILKLMANLWQCQKQHLIKDVTKSKDFWNLFTDPLFKNFEQAPMVYGCILKILSMHFSVALKTSNDEKEFYTAIKKFLTDQKQLRLFQQYIFKIFSNDELSSESVKEREFLIKSWTELLITVQKQNIVSYFPNSECEYLYIELVFDGILNKVVHSNVLSAWIDFTLVVVDMFGLQYEQRLNELAAKVIEYAKIIKIYYEDLSLKDKKVALTTILKIIESLKSYYETRTPELLLLLEEFGSLVDSEYTVLTDEVYKRLKDDDITSKDWLGPWALIIAIANIILTLKNCGKLVIWFGNRKYLDKIIDSTGELLSYKVSLLAGKMAMYSLTLYVESPLAYDFLNVNMLIFFDRLEPMVNALLSGRLTKVNVLDLKEGWLIFNLLIKFNQSFLRKFEKQALDSCYTFLTLNEHIIKHIMNLPENTVDLRALDLLTQTLIYYLEILKNWKIEWFRKSNKTFTFMTDGIRKVINACIYLCLRPKHIGFYYLDNSFRLVALDQNEDAMNDLMISVINRLIGILGIAFSCLYHLNSKLTNLFDYFEPDESVIILIQNDFSVPRFELPIPCDLTYGKLLCLAHFLCKTINQLEQKKEKSLKIDESQYNLYIGLVEHQDPSEYLPEQKLSSFLRYLYEYSGLIDPWINNLNSQNVQKTADILMLFIAQQAFLSLKILDPHQVPYYKRNLYTELQFFNEYIRKHTSELIIKSSGSSRQTYSSDMDYLKRYLLAHWQNKDKGKSKSRVWEKNFLLLIYYWFTNICQIQ